MHTLTFARCNDRTGYYNIITLVFSFAPLAPLNQQPKLAGESVSLIKQLI